MWGSQLPNQGSNPHPPALAGKVWATREVPNLPVSELELGTGQARGSSPVAGEEPTKLGSGCSCQATTDKATPLHPPSGPWMNSRKHTTCCSKIQNTGQPPCFPVRVFQEAAFSKETQFLNFRHIFQEPAHGLTDYLITMVRNKINKVGTDLSS